MALWIGSVSSSTVGGFGDARASGRSGAAWWGRRRSAGPGSRLHGPGPRSAQPSVPIVFGTSGAGRRPSESGPRKVDGLAPTVSRAVGVVVTGAGACHQPTVPTVQPTVQHTGRRRPRSLRGRA